MGGREHAADPALNHRSRRSGQTERRQPVVRVPIRIPARCATAQAIHTARPGRDRLIRFAAVPRHGHLNRSLFPVNSRSENERKHRRSHRRIRPLYDYFCDEAILVSSRIRSCVAEITSSATVLRFESVRLRQTRRGSHRLPYLQRGAVACGKTPPAAAHFDCSPVCHRESLQIKALC